jgi:hypothetical protein
VEARFDEAVRELADAVVAEHTRALADAGLRTTVEVRRWAENDAANSELRVAFWRGNAFIDVLEDFIVRDGRPVASLDELRDWLNAGVEAILQETSEG